MINFTDAVNLTGKPRFTDDGYLVATAKVARSGIQIYAGDEVGRPDLESVAVYRPETEVFSDATMQSFAYRPMTNDHPTDDVNADNWRELAVGQVGAEVARDGDYIRVPLVLMDGAAIASYKDGKRELSMGYRADIEFEDGVTPGGEAYQAVQRNIRNNHMALVDAGRAGSEARIGDKGGQRKQPNLKPKGGSAMQTIKFGDVTIEVNEQAAEAINSLSAKLEAAQAEAEEAEDKASKAAEVSDKALAAKDAEIDKLKSDAMTPEKLDAEIKQRVELIGDAKKIADVDYSGKGPDEIRKAAVTAVIGDSVADKSDAYIEARFDTLLEDRADDGQQIHNDHHKPNGGQAAYVNKLQDAWKREK